ncbi:MAG: LD-carboxypeptidase [Chloroflexi bacterium]|nr:LD-carboxypeptidase [Chloroflexota bacterium]
MKIIKPRRLAPGCTVGIVAPSSAPAEPDAVRFAADIVRSFGMHARIAAHAFDRSGYLAGSDADRAADVNDMFADPSIDAIFCLRGGYGASRLLPLLDYDAIAANPKPLIGYSDITALHLAIHARTGLVTFHGPIAAQQFSPYTLSEFKRVLFGSDSSGEAEWPARIAAPPPFKGREGQVEKANRVVMLAPGKACGRLLGGNLSLLAHLCGTPHLPDFTDTLLFLEDVGEAHYAIDRYLTQLWLAGILQKVRGVAFGKFTDPAAASWLHNRSLEDVLGERCRALGIPAVMGLMIGHIDDQATVPLGCMAELDADAGTLTLLEAAVGR